MRAPTVKRPERALRNAILELLRAHGIAAWPTGVGAFPASYQGRQRFVRVGSKGMADIIGGIPRCLRCGYFPRMPWCKDDGVRAQLLAIEVKNPGGTVSPEQTAFLQTVVRAGGVGFVARSIDDVIAKLGLAR